MQKKGLTFGAKLRCVIGDISEARGESDYLRMKGAAMQYVADTDATQKQTLQAKNCGPTRHKPLEIRTSTALRWTEDRAAAVVAA